MCDRPLYLVPADKVRVVESPELPTFEPVLESQNSTARRSLDAIRYLKLFLGGLNSRRKIVYGFCLIVAAIVIGRQIAWEFRPEPTLADFDEYRNEFEDVLKSLNTNTNYEHIFVTGKMDYGNPVQFLDSVSGPMPELNVSCIYFVTVKIPVKTLQQDMQSREAFTLMCQAASVKKNRRYSYDFAFWLKESMDFNEQGSFEGHNYRAFWHEEDGMFTVCIY